MMQRVYREIELGTFSRADYFLKPVEDLERRFSHYADNWLTKLVSASSTRRGYASALDRIWRPAFGETHLSDIRPGDIRAIVRRRAERVSARTVNNELIPLRAVFEAAIEEGIIYRSPMVPIHNMRPRRGIPNPFPRTEMENLLRHLRAECPAAVGAWYEFAFGTGLRPSEQIALPWSDVNWELRTVRVERAMLRSELKDTKTGQARAVDLTDRTLGILERLRQSAPEIRPLEPIFRTL